MSAPAAEQRPRRVWQVTTPPGLLRRAAHLLRNLDTAEYDPLIKPLVGGLLAAAESMTASPGSVNARLAATALRARMLDIAHLVVDEHDRAVQRGHLAAVPDLET